MERAFRFLGRSLALKAFFAHILQGGNSQVAQNIQGQQPYRFAAHGSRKPYAAMTYFYRSITTVILRALRVNGFSLSSRLRWQECTS